MMGVDIRMSEHRQAYDIKQHIKIAHLRSSVMLIIHMHETCCELSGVNSMPSDPAALELSFADSADRCTTPGNQSSPCRTNATNKTPRHRGSVLSLHPALTCTSKHIPMLTGI